MEFVDRHLKCSDCNTDFIFTAGEQLFFSEKQFKNDPKRCKLCKAKRAGTGRAVGTGVTCRCCAAAFPHGDPHGVLRLRRGNHCPLQTHAGTPCPLPKLLSAQACTLGCRRRRHARLARPAGRRPAGCRRSGRRHGSVTHPGLSRSHRGSHRAGTRGCGGGSQIRSPHRTPRSHRRNRRRLGPFAAHISVSLRRCDLRPFSNSSTACRSCSSGPASPDIARSYPRSRPCPASSCRP